MSLIEPKQAQLRILSYAFSPYNHLGPVPYKTLWIRKVWIT